MDMHYGTVLEKEEGKIAVSALILPKFELGDITGDGAGEAQYYFDAYVKGGEIFEIAVGLERVPLYFRNGVALFVTGMGKFNIATRLQALLLDPRFDFSDALILSTGCSGCSVDTTVLGDVVLITAMADADLGHIIDSSEIPGERETTWYHEPSFDGSAYVICNAETVDAAWALVKDIPMQTDESTVSYIREKFMPDGGEIRMPKVIRGTAVSGDNYWKGRYGHNNAVLMAKTYGCPDPYAVCEMEDFCVARLLAKYGMLKNLVAIRVCVNYDLFAEGDTPETLWGGDASLCGLETQVLNLFDTAMKNVFAVGSAVIDNMRG